MATITKKTDRPGDAEILIELEKIEAEIANHQAAINGLNGARAALLYALGKAPLFAEKPQEPKQ